MEIELNVMPFLCSNNVIISIKSIEETEEGAFIQKLYELSKKKREKNL